MSKRTHTCRTCYHWRQFAAPDTELGVPDTGPADLGVCEAEPPVVIFDKIGPLKSVQPATHATRSCALFEPHPDWGGDAQPPTAKVRHLRPVSDLPPAA